MKETGEKRGYYQVLPLMKYDLQLAKSGVSAKGGRRHRSRPQWIKITMDSDYFPLELFR